MHFSQTSGKINVTYQTRWMSFSKVASVAQRIPRTVVGDLHARIMGVTHAECFQCIG